MTLQQIQLGIISFANAELLQKAQGMQKFMIGVGIGIFTKKFEDMAVDFLNKPIASNLGIIDSAGNINIEMLEPIIRDSMRITERVPIAGITFTEADVDNLFQHIKVAGGGK